MLRPAVCRLAQEQAYTQVVGDVNFLAIGQQAGIANGHAQLALDDALDVDFNAPASRRGPLRR